MTLLISTSFGQYLFSDTHKCLSFTKLRTLGWLKICFHSYPAVKTVLKVIVIDSLLMLSALLKIIISEFFHKPCSSLKRNLEPISLWNSWENIKINLLGSEKNWQTQLNWLHLYQHLLANIYFPTLINVWVPQSCVQWKQF